MTETNEIMYAGSSIFVDFPIDGAVLPVTMTCVAKMYDKNSVVLNTYIATPNDGTFELRIPYTDTTTFAGTGTLLLVRVTDTATNYSDVIYNKKISWK
jgi:hypothetical protein